jgi:hypothetical protein
MSKPIEPQNDLLKKSLNAFNLLSFYSPIVICVGVIMFSMFTATYNKAGIYLCLVFFVSCIRRAFYKPSLEYVMPEICLTGLEDMMLPRDVTYSIFILTFTMVYFVIPMILVSTQTKTNMINYGIIFFFIAYIILDIYVKYNLKCISSTYLILTNFIAALFVGGLIVLLMYGSKMKTYLYINEANSNKEVCSMPTKQQFKCNVYKNGELVGNL